MKVKELKEASEHLWNEIELSIDVKDRIVEVGYIAVCADKLEIYEFDEDEDDSARLTYKDLKESMSGCSDNAEVSVFTKDGCEVPVREFDNGTFLC